MFEAVIAPIAFAVIVMVVAGYAGVKYVRRRMRGGEAAGTTDEDRDRPRAVNE